jgi:T1SS-143 domain-containing protein
MSGNETIFTVTLSDTGTGGYNFVLSGALDHPVKASGAANEDVLSLTFNATVRDSDGDQIKTSFTIGVIDDSPIVPSTNATVLLDDDALSGGNAGGVDDDIDAANVTGTLSHSYGADGAGSVLLTGAGLTTVKPGEGLFFQSLSSDGKTLQISQVQHGTSVLVLTVTVTDAAAGTYKVVQNNAIQHVSGGNENNQSFTIGYQVTDGDGDTAKGTLSINVDDSSIKWTASDSASVNEDDLKGGNDFPQESTTATGKLNISWGADNYDVAGRNDGAGRSLVFATTGSVSAVDSLGNAIALTSNGQALTYVLSDNGTKLVASAHGETIFTVTVNDDSTGSYSFKLQGSLDQNVQGEDALKLTFHTVATDSDGDKANVDFAVSVTDDVPLAIGQIITRYVEEEELKGGNEDNSPNVDGDFSLLGHQVDVTTKSAGGALNILWGSDDANAVVNGGVGVLGDRSVVFATVAGSANVATTDAAAFISVKSGNQTIALADLTSGGHALTYTLSANGTILTAHVGNETIFTVTLSDTGTGGYNFVLSGVLDHPVHASGAALEDVLSLTFNATVRDSDGDQVKTSFTIGVIDDSPVVSSNAVVQLDDDALAGGNANGTGDDANAVNVTGTLAHSYGADGAGSVLLTGAGLGTAGSGEGTFFQSVSADGKTVEISQVQHGQTVVVLTVTLTNTTSGNYTVVQNHAIQHAAGGNENNQLFTIGYQVKDGEGDTAKGSLTINVDDDTPTIVAPVAGHVSEVGSSQILSNGTFEHDSLASGQNGVINDVRGNYSFSAPTGWTISGGTGGIFVPTAAIVSAAGHDGGNVVWLRDGATLAKDTGTTLVAGQVYSLHFDVGNRADQDFGGGVAKLIAVNGNQTVVLSSINLTEPADGKWGSVDLNSSVIDPQYAGWHLHVEISQTSGTGNQILIDDVELRQFTPSVANGSLGISWGADDDVDHRAVGFNAQQPSGLTSNGDAIHYTLSTDHTLLTAVSDDGRTIFTVELSKTTGEYKFTLLDTLDHQSVPQAGLQFAFTATDADGDPASSTFAVAINDDASVVSNPNGSAPGVSNAGVYEGGIEALGGQPAGTDAGHGNVATGNLLVNFGADGFGSTAFTGAFAVPNGNSGTLVAGGAGADSGLTSDGRAVLFSLSSDAHTIEGRTASGEVILRAVLDQGDAGWKVTLLGNIDHQPGDIGRGEGQSLNFTVVAKDGDGDSVNLTLSTRIHDDKPVVSAAADTGHVSETGLPGVSSGFGSLHVNLGADNKATHVEIGRDGNGQPVINPGLTSDGVPLEYLVRTTNGVDQEIVAFKHGESADNPVFIVSVLHPGSFATTLFQNLDHPAGSDPLTLNLVARVYDGDGDYVDQPFSVVVNDDVPTITGSLQPANLLANGNFASGTWAHEASWGAWATESTGWKIEGTAPGQQGVQLERVTDNYLGMHATGGSPMVDLGASPGNIAISQNITGLTEGDSYKLTFEAGSPDKDSSKLEVYWNGHLWATIDPTSQMKGYSLDLPAVAGTNTLTFKEVGEAGDNTGTYLANVSLTHGSDVPVFHAVTGEDSGPVSFHLVQGADFSFGADNNGVVSFDTAHVTIATPNGTTISLPPAAYSYDSHTGIFTINPGWGFNGLSAGEVATLTVPFKVTDGDGDSKFAVYQLTITGSNDQVTTSEAFSDKGTITEYQEHDPRAGSTDDRTEFDAPAGYAGPKGGAFYVYDDQGDKHSLTIQPGGDHYLGTLTASVTEETVNDGVGLVTWNYHVTDAALNPLAEGETKVETFRVTVDDGHGTSTFRDIVVTLVGTNDSPVINVDASKISADIFEKGSLDAVGADMAADQRFEPAVNIDGFLASKLVSGVDMEGLLAQVQQQIGPKASVADAIATVWDYVDDHGGYYNNVLNEMSARLGVEYAKYLAAGGKPLLDAIAKYIADGADAGSAPDRLQSLHDNLLGNLDGASLIDKLLGAGQGSNANPVPAVYQAILDLLHANHLDDLLSRPIYSGNEGVTNNALAWDQQHGLVPVAGGQLVATDVDHDAHLTWSIAGPNTYGTISIDPATGKWAYLLNDGSAATQGLNEGETVQQVFTATVTDEHGATDTQQITLTIHGSNDAPVISLEGGDRDFVSLVEGNAGLSADGTLSVADVDNNDVVAVSVTGVSATGSNIESHFTADQLKGFFSVDSGAVISGGAHAGDIHWNFNSGTQAFDFLPKGWQSIISYTVQVTDSHGGVDTHVVQVKLTGTNDAPVITSAPVTASVTEAGDLPGISEAGSGGGLSSHVALSTATTAAIALIATAPTAANFNAALHDIAHDLPAGGDALADRATAITVLWNALDDSYTSAGANQININQGFTQLGLAYVQYLKDGGAPLTDIIAKYAADGGDADTLPDRLQSLHDNLLGNLTTYALTQRYGSDATLFDQYKAQVTAADASLLDRPYHSGTEGSDSDVRTWDQQHGYESTAHGQFTATDVDLNHTLIWSISGSNTYGAMSIDASTGKWIYQLDDSRAGTQGLGAGESATETYTATVTDEYGATATQQVTITVHGSNDAPVVTAAVTTANYVEPNGSNIGKLDGYKIFSAANGFAVSDADVHNAGYKSVTVTADEGDRLFIRQSDQAGLKLNNGEVIITQSEKSSNTLIITADGHNMTEAEVKAILQKIIFHTDEHTAASETHHIAIVVEDANGNLSAPLGITVNVTGTNDAPTGYANFSVTTGEDHAFAFTPQSVGDTKITFEDLDDDSSVSGGTLGQLTIAANHGVVTVNLAEYPGLKILSVDGVPVIDGGHGSYTGHSIVVEGAAGKNGPIDQLTDSDHGTGITFNPDANFNGAATITLSYSDRGDDGLPASAPAVQTITVNVTPENDAPHLTLGQTTGLTIAEDTRLYFAETGAKNWVSSDPDQPYGTVQTVTLTLHVDAGGTFTASQDGLSGGFNIVTSDGGHTISITTTADSNGSRDAYAILNSLLRGDNHNPGNLNGIAFTPDHDYNGTVNVQYTLDDHGGIGGATGLTDTGSFTIDVTPVNDAPVVDLDTSAAGNDAVGTAVEQMPQWVFDKASLGDVDNTTLASLKATLTVSPDGANDTLALNTVAQNAATAAGLHVTFANGTLTITGTAAVSTYETILKGIAYENTSDNPSAADRVIQVVANDGHADSVAHSIAVHVIPLNDAPVLTGDLTASVEKGHSYVLTTSDVSFTDPDNTVVTFLVSNQQHGTIQVGGAAATSFTSAELLAGIVTFAHDNSAGNSAGFDIKVEDGNQDGSVPVSQPFHLDVTAPNLAPTPHNLSIITDAANGTNLPIPVQALLWNQHDPEGKALSFSIADQAHVKYTAGDDHITYTVQQSGNPFHFGISDGVNAPVDVSASVSRASLVGGNSDDFLVGYAPGAHQILGGFGNDVIVGGAGSNALYGDGVFENVKDGNDLLIGGDGASNALYGGGGNDMLIGGAGGSNTLDGGSGDDLLYGGAAGQNTLTGGAGHDTFFIDASALSKLDPADIITDFTTGNGANSDKLDVSSLLNALIAQQPGMSDADALSKLTATPFRRPAGGCG